MVNELDRKDIVNRVFLLRAWHFLEILKRMGWEIDPIVHADITLQQRVLTMFLRINRHGRIRTFKYNYLL